MGVLRAGRGLLGRDCVLKFVCSSSVGPTIQSQDKGSRSFVLILEIPGLHPA